MFSFIYFFLDVLLRCNSKIQFNEEQTTNCPNNFKLAEVGLLAHFTCKWAWSNKSKIHATSEAHVHNSFRLDQTQLVHAIPLEKNSSL
jgi:hypothetical protein